MSLLALPLFCCIFSFILSFLSLVIPSRGLFFFMLHSIPLLWSSFCDITWFLLVSDSMPGWGGGGVLIVFFASCINEAFVVCGCVLSDPAG